MARLRSNGVRVVLVERADRLARDLMVSEVILGQFRETNVNPQPVAVVLAGLAMPALHLEAETSPVV